MIYLFRRGMTDVVRLTLHSPQHASLFMSNGMMQAHHNLNTPHGNQGLVIEVFMGCTQRGFVLERNDPPTNI